MSAFTDLAEQADEEMDGLRDHITRLESERDAINAQFLALQAMHAKVCGEFADACVRVDGERDYERLTITKLQAELDGLRDEFRVAEGDAVEWKRRHDELVATRVPMERVDGGDLWREVAT